MEVSACNCSCPADIDLPLTLRGQLLPEVGRVLVLDVLDNGVPAAVVVDKITVAGSVDNVQAETHAVLLNYMSDSLDLGGLPDRLGRRKAALGLDEVGGEDGVDQGGLSETGLACEDGQSVCVAERLEECSWVFAMRVWIV